MRFFDIIEYYVIGTIQSVVMCILWIINMYIFAEDIVACFSTEIINFIMELCKLMFKQENFKIISI